MSDTTTTPDAQTEGESQAAAAPATTSHDAPGADTATRTTETRETRTVQSDEWIAQRADLEARVKANADDAKAQRQSKAAISRDFDAYKAESTKTIDALNADLDAARTRVRDLERANVLAPYGDDAFDDDARKVLDGIDDLDALRTAASRFAATGDPARPAVRVPAEGKTAAASSDPMRTFVRTFFNQQTT